MITGVELIGYVASGFVAISLLMSSFLLLRLLNLVGSLAFVVYAALLGSVPVLLTNSFIVVVNIVYLVRMARPNLNGFRYVHSDPGRRAQLLDFVVTHGEDIRRFFPHMHADGIDAHLDAGAEAFMALRDNRVEGFALVHGVDAATKLPQGAPPADLYAQLSDGERVNAVVVTLDYVRRRYRGLGLVHHLFECITQTYGATRRPLLCPVHRSAVAHRRFLTRHGFEPRHAVGDFTLFAKR